MNDHLTIANAKRSQMKHPPPTAWPHDLADNPPITFTHVSGQQVVVWRAGRFGSCVTFPLPRDELLA
jgi:hypothetical protein